MSESKRHGPLRGCPSRQDMISAAILMEQKGFRWDEWSTMVKLCDSDLQIRQYILSFAKDCLDMWEGLVPNKGHFDHEIAFIAAYHINKKILKEMAHYSDEQLHALLDPPDPWTEEQTEKKWRAYLERHPYRRRVTTKLLEKLEQEAAAIYHEPYTTHLIPLAWREGRHRNDIA